VAYSDILTNTPRGIFAEFLVAKALGVVEGVRPTGWNDFDLSYDGWKIEVKASAYVQSWHQETPSVIRFDIGERGSWDAETNAWRPDPVRSADCYVFCRYSRPSVAGPTCSTSANGNSTRSRPDGSTASSGTRRASG
jgi:hypothetical protein